ncbi:MAG: hypothetical protein KAT77_02655 [Nanoarchaeota archaeon]|nr:hypothetical protein [Nanoarchaeota archaeon]
MTRINNPILGILDDRLAKAVDLEERKKSFNKLHDLDFLLLISSNPKAVAAHKAGMSRVAEIFGFDPPRREHYDSNEAYEKAKENYWKPESMIRRGHERESAEARVRGSALNILLGIKGHDWY